MTSAHPVGDSVELRLRELSQLFDIRDPSPFYEKDLAPDAEEYIVASATEARSKKLSMLVVHLEEQGVVEHSERIITQAVQEHFARRAHQRRRALRQLLRRGWISLVIGVAFLAVFFAVAQAAAMSLGDSPWATLMREGFVIGGWVAMWRPLEIFLYDWWPIVVQRRLYERLSGLDVRVLPARANGSAQPNR
jgi:hypothetical protein